MKCIFKNKYLKHLDRFEIQAYNSITGFPVDIEDCDNCRESNESPADPIAPCSDFLVETLYSLEGGLTGFLRNREWHGTEPATGVISDVDIATRNGRNFRENHDFDLPTTTDNTTNSLILNDTNNTGSELDIQVIEGYIVAYNQIDARYSGGSEGYWAVELGKCCGELELLGESGGFSSNPLREMRFTIPKGIHEIRLWNIDSGGSNSSATFGYSTDGGATYINDNTPPGLRLTQAKPNEVCKKVKICKDSGVFLDLFTDAVIDQSECYSCPLACIPSNYLTC